MKVVVQKVTSSNCKVDNEITGEINTGYLLLVGFGLNDNKDIVLKMAEKISKLRIFEDENGKINRSIYDVNGKILSISQFTLYADCKKGNRPSFIQAAKPVPAEKLYNYIIEKCKETGINIQTGIFGADMKVELINDGPVTIILDSEQL